LPAGELLGRLQHIVIQIKRCSHDALMRKHQGIIGGVLSGHRSLLAGLALTTIK
jgi:hypothetical protein